MKQLLLILSMALFFAACEKKNEPTLDPYTQIVLNGATTKVLPAQAPYSLDTITRYAFELGFLTVEYPNSGGRTIIDRDLKANKLRIGQQSDVVVIDKQGVAHLGWMVQDLQEVVLTANYIADRPDEWIDPMVSAGGGVADKRDTIGYIPSAVVLKAEADIKAAFNAGDYDECMRLFREAYVFIPTTGPEWRALKAKGEN